MASDFFLEAMQSLPDSLFAPSPFDLLSATTDQSGVHPAMMASASRGSKSSESRRTRPHPPQAIKCPRCDSQNTKFCYYNNYNLSQPRHFCKACRRYWTNGGVLRNVPIGGGCRKNKKSTSSSSSASAKQASQKSPENSVTPGNFQNSSSSSPSSSSSSSVLPDPSDFRCIAELNEIMRFSTGIDCSSTVPPLNTSDFSSMLSSSTMPYNLSHTDQIQIQNHGDLSVLGAFSSGLGGVPEFPWKFHKQRESFLNYSTQQQVPPALENLQNYASVSGSSNTVGETSPAEQSHAGGNYSFEALFDEWSRWNDDSADRPHHWSLAQQESCVYLP